MPPEPGFLFTVLRACNLPLRWAWATESAGSRPVSCSVAACSSWLPDLDNIDSELVDKFYTSWAIMSIEAHNQGSLIQPQNTSATMWGLISSTYTQISSFYLYINWGWCRIHQYYAHAASWTNLLLVETLTLCTTASRHGATAPGRQCALWGWAIGPIKSMSVWIPGVSSVHWFLRLLLHRYRRHH